MKIKTDVVIVGTGVAGMFSALKLPRDKKIVIITKEDMRSSDSFWHRAGSVYSVMKMIMTAILKTP